MNDVPAPTTRARHGRWLGGVCAGLAARWDVPVAPRAARVRARVAAGRARRARLHRGLADPAGRGRGRRRPARHRPAGPGLRRAARARRRWRRPVRSRRSSASAGSVVGARGVPCWSGRSPGWARLGPAWALLPVGALVLPSVAMAVGGVRIEPSTLDGARRPAHAGRAAARAAAQRARPADRRPAPHPLPATGTIPLKIEAGVRRTLIALPHDRCVHVTVVQRDAPPLLRARRGAGRRGEPAAAAAGLRPLARAGSRRRPRRRRPGPTLAVDFSSAGGELVVRDYPDDVDPDLQPDWPGYPVYVEDAAGHDRPRHAPRPRRWCASGGRGARCRSAPSADRSTDGRTVHGEALRHGRDGRAAARRRRGARRRPGGRADRGRGPAAGRRAGAGARRRRRDRAAGAGRRAAPCSRSFVLVPRGARGRRAGTRRCWSAPCWPPRRWSLIGFTGLFGDNALPLRAAGPGGRAAAAVDRRAGRARRAGAGRRRPARAARPDRA